MRSVLILVGATLIIGLTSCLSESSPVRSPESTNAAVVTLSPGGATPPTTEGTAAQYPTPSPTMESFNFPSDQVERISIKELKALMDSGEQIVILDVREQGYYRVNHIQGAISFPWKPTLTEVDIEAIPSGRLIVTYCQCGPGEADGADMAWKLIELGLNNVKTLAHPSIDGWIKLGYPTE